MVHALEQVHRLLAPEGRLIDIHPVADALSVEVHHRGKVVFAERVAFSNAEGVQQADEALAEVIRRRLFAAEQNATFDFRTYGASVAELRDYLVAANAFAEESDLAERWEEERAETVRRAEEGMRAAGPGALVATYEQARITRLRPLPL